ncbi:MAG: hydrogenase maturation protease [candidate division KSB1 bacterium]|nr:hydrogenase maturation protease [candidate division KSB1 bacterium]
MIHPEIINSLEQLSKRPELAGAHYIAAGTNPENYLEKILQAEPQLVVFIDAVDGPRPPGEIFWIAPDELDSAGMSTHAFSLRMIERYLLAHVPLEVRYLGIQAATTRVGSGLSDFVMKSLDAFFAGT